MAQQAVLAADIIFVGRPEVLRRDDEQSRDLLTALRRNLIYPVINEFWGELLRTTTGPELHIVFANTGNCVRCAIALIEKIQACNEGLAPSQWIDIQIGIAIGADPDQAFNEALDLKQKSAETGSVHLSAQAYQQVRKMEFRFRPVDDGSAYELLDHPEIEPTDAPPRSIVKLAGIAGAMVLVVLAGGGWLVGSFMRDQEALPPQRVVIASHPITLQPVTTLAAEPVPEPVPLQSPAAIVQPVTSSVALAPAAPSPQPLPVAPSPPLPAAPSPPLPEMVAIPGGIFLMGSNDNSSERPSHKVMVASFLLAKYPVTIQQWRACQYCVYSPPLDGNDDAPINNVSWDDAQQYVKWLSDTTGQAFRLPSEAEWEYAARGGTSTRFWWGDTILPNRAVCRGCGEAALPVKIGTHEPNPFGLYDLNGGLAEWVQDCWAKDYTGAPVDGSARVQPICPTRVLRGAAWNNTADYARSANRSYYDAGVRYPAHGLRVARSE